MSRPINRTRTAFLAAVGAALLLAAQAPSAQADHRRPWASAHHHGHHARHGHWRHKVRHLRAHRRAHHHHRQVVHVNHINTSSTNPFSIGAGTGGTILGALVGAVTGSRFGKGKGKLFTVAGGTILGALVGGKIGRSMERGDHDRVARTLETSADGTPVAWRNPNTGTDYSVTPTRTYRVAGNKDCRDYTTWVFIDGYEQEVQGSACRNSDGTWQMVP